MTFPAPLESVPEPRDFWLSSGHHLLDRGEGGGLVVTDAFLKAYLARPELVPEPHSCAVERTLHAALLAEPRRPVERAILEEIADPDARENWQIMVAFRDRLLRHQTLESAYLALVRRGVGATPPLFVNQLVHAVLRNLLDGCSDPYVLRAAELFFRPQQLALHEGALIAADAELIGGATSGTVAPLVAFSGQRAETVDVLADSNAESYWRRSDGFDMALDLTAGRRGQQALGEVIRRWIEHLLTIEVEVEPVTALTDAKFSWYVGLDAEGTRIGDGLWKGEPFDNAAAVRIAALFRLTFRDETLILERARGEPVYLIMAMAPDMSLRLKPQNLIAGLPLQDQRTLS